MGEKWMIWTVLEGLTKMSAKVLQKTVGIHSSLIGHMLLATATIGVVQLVCGWAVCRRKGVEILDVPTNVIGSCMFGGLAFMMTVLGFCAFLPQYDGDVGVVTFIITLSIIPGAFIDQFWFGKKVSGRKWMGVAVAIVAGYSVLNWPTLEQMIKLPMWVFMAAIIMLLAAINQGITQEIKSVDPFVKNFWGGLVAILMAMVCVVWRKEWALLWPSTWMLQRIVTLSGVVGLIVVGMWCFNLVSYKEGASIVLKKLVMNGTYLLTTMMVGVLWYNEEFTVGKATGMILYMAAFCIIDDGTWKMVRSFKVGYK